MRSFPRRDIDKALRKKGFFLEERDHYYYNFYYNGKKTNIWTKLSRGTKYEDYSIRLLGEIKKELRLDSLKQLEDLLRCPMEQEHYEKHLKGKNQLSD
jgi:hypothetical protein